MGARVSGMAGCKCGEWPHRSGCVKDSVALARVFGLEDQRSQVTTFIHQSFAQRSRRTMDSV